MQERAAMIGAELKIHTHLGEGTANRPGGQVSEPPKYPAIRVSQLVKSYRSGQPNAVDGISFETRTWDCLQAA